jgi:2-polyprenyl-3-methyl-5-hydroxy-6-metoxy-1,4-benzoquinol methylase
MQESNALDTDSLERIVPDELDEVGATGRETLLLHLARYVFAARHLCGTTVLDIACGVGYGTQLLINQNPQIQCAQGVDLSLSTIDYARKHYAHPRAEYFCEDAQEFRGKGVYDNVVSLETIEHVPDPERLFQHLVELVRPGGVFVASVPTTPSTDGNPHHLTDFTERSFRKLGFGAHLREIDCLRQVQYFNPAAVALGNEKRLARSRTQLAKFYLRRPHKLALRMWATARYGFENRYLTIAWQKPS